MKHLLKTVLATAALVTIAGTASAEDTTFEVTFSFDRNAPVDVTYARILETAKQPCEIQYPLSTTGYSRDAMKRFRKKCERTLVEQALNAIKDPSLAMLHRALTGKSLAQTKLANAKRAPKSRS